MSAEMIIGRIITKVFYNWDIGRFVFYRRYNSIRRQKNNESYYHNKALNKKDFSTENGTESVLNKNLNQSDFSTENGTDSCSHARREREIKKETTSLKKVSLRDEEAEAEKSSVVPKAR